MAIINLTFSQARYILLVSTKIRDHWEGPTPEIGDSLHSQKIGSNGKIQFSEHAQRIPFVLYKSNLVPRAHESFGQRQDTELWNNQSPESKILGVPVSRRMRALVYMASRDKVDVDAFHKDIQ